ncbi:MAG TPA: glycosyltransferase family 4 protein [Chondromyces sp.]|nr:glycosyltransferase family 4 protein [Chondromyces sp.]
MNTFSDFPYPYIVDTMDRHYGEDPLPQEKNRKKSGEKLSILIATFWDYPHTGGLSNYITTMSNGLKALGHQVDIISPNQFPTEEVKQLRKQIVPELKKFFLERYGSYSKKILLSSRLLYIYEQMMKQVDLTKYDILHAQDIFTANVLGRLNTNYNKPLFFTPHGMFTLNRLRFNLIEKGSVEEAYYRRIEEKAIQFSSHTIILSESFCGPLQEFGAQPHSMSTVYTGIDYRKPSKNNDIKKSKKLVISCVARLNPRKGHSLLLDALVLLKDKSRNIELWIIGDGEMKESLEKQAESLKLSNVKFFGKRNDIPEILERTDIFVLPTMNDSLPVAIIEAMHSKTAIITTNCGGIPEIIQHGKTGLIVEPGNIDELAKALRQLINNGILRNRLAKKAYDFAEKHLTSKAMVSKIEALYEKFLHRKEET